MSSRYWHLILYVDNDPTPQHATVDRPESLEHLLAMVEETASVSLLQVSYWDPQIHSYMPLETLDPIVRSRGRAQLWVQSDGLKLEEVHKAVDEQEYRELRQYAQAVNNDHVTYHLVDAHRVVFPRLEMLFEERKLQLLDPSAATMMLFYTGNANTSSDAVQKGFVLPRNGGLVFTTNLSDPNQTAPPQQAQKVLVCEVAVGRVQSANELHRGFDASSADSLVMQRGSARTYTVFSPHQAVPRYVLTLRGTATSSGVLPPSGSGRITQRRATPTPTRPESVDAVRAATPTTPPTTSAQRPNDTAFLCSAHRGESTSLWCGTCSQLVCAYCLSVGHHRGHDGRELDEVIGKYRMALTDASSALSDKQETVKRTLDMLQSTKRELEDRQRQGEESLRSAMDELSNLLKNKHKELADELGSKSNSADTEVSELRAYMNTCQAKRKEFETLILSSQDAAKVGKMEFLRTAPQSLAEWTTHPFPKPPIPASLTPAAPGTFVNTRPVAVAIKNLQLLKAPPRPPGDVTVNMTDDVEASVTAGLVQQQLAVCRHQLEDLCSGYIWVVPGAEKMFHVDQRKDIFSDVFFLGGASWEIRLASEIVPVNDALGASHHSGLGEPHDHISAYLHSVNHTHRMNFRIIMFAANGHWHMREAKGWSAEFAGKGWGIRPFCSRKQLLRDFIHDGLVKFCICPVGPLY